MSLYADIISLEEYDDVLSKTVIEEAISLRDCFKDKENLILKDKLNGNCSLEESYQKILDAYHHHTINPNELPGQTPWAYFMMFSELVPIKLKSQPFARLGTTLNVGPSGHKLMHHSNLERIVYLDKKISEIMNLD